jgi:hypothetical protein
MFGWISVVKLHCIKKNKIMCRSLMALWMSLLVSNQMLCSRRAELFDDRNTELAARKRLTACVTIFSTINIDWAINHSPASIYPPKILEYLSQTKTQATVVVHKRLVGMRSTVRWLLQCNE